MTEIFREKTLQVLRGPPGGISNHVLMEMKVKVCTEEAKFRERVNGMGESE